MEYERNEVLEKLQRLLDQRKFSELKNQLNDINAVDVADFLEDQQPKILVFVYRLLSKELASEVFSHLSSEYQTQLSILVRDDELNDILDDLYFDDMIDFLEEMPANVVKRILRDSTEKERSLINQFLNYPDNSAGSLMTIELVDLKKEMSVTDALERIRKTAFNKETIYICYAINAKRVLEGIVSLKDIVLASSDKKIEDIMQTDIIYVNTHDDQEEIAEIFKKYNFLALPVVDNEKRLVGIITIDDIVDVIEEENTEDIHKMAALTPMEEEYLNAGIFNLAKKRILWMLVLMISATLTSYIMNKYETTLSAVIALSAFIPMLMNTGGNAGSQASTLSIRSIVLGETEFKDIFKVIWIEFRVSFIVGFALSVVNFARIYLFESRIYGEETFKIAFSVSSTMLITIMMAKIIGGMLPLLAQKIKLDPAIMATPLISTIVDALTLIIYFTIASQIFIL